MRRKERYEKPTITRHTLGLMNKFGRSAGITPFGHIDGVSVRELVHEFGSPLWVVSEGALRRRYRELHRAFAGRYPKVTIAYSYKTNYLASVCAVLHQEGAWAEVVSGFEYEIAGSLGVHGSQIVFNGPYKTPEELRRAADNGSVLNVDSHDEISALEQVAEERGRPVDVGVRINMEVNYPPWDRFGFNYESGQAFDACQRVMTSDQLNLTGLHIHVGTYVADVNVYTEMARRLVAFSAALRQELGANLRYLDIGGGFASRNTLHTQYVPGEYTCPTFDQYAEAICPVLLVNGLPVEEQPRLILEPGRCIVDEAMCLLCSVVTTKRLSTGQKAAVLDAGVNLLPTSVWYRHNIVPAQEGGSLLEDVNLYGPLCMQIDVIRLNVSLPPLSRGDVLVVENVGAYNFSQSMQFIQPRPAVVLLNEGKAEHVRMPETFAYLRELDRLPDRLRIRPAE